MPPAGASRAVAAAPSADRRQSTRQGRTSVTRPTNYYARTFAGRLAAAGGLEQTPPASNGTAGFLPALTHFTQAVDAFPKELIKHFSMFKEVEAKIHDPEHVLQLLLDQIAKQPITTMGQRRAAIHAQVGGENSARASANGLVAEESAPTRHQRLAQELFQVDISSLSAEEQADLKKRQLFHRFREVIASMLPTLDEKLVVLTSAKATKDKGLARLNTSYPHLDDEISEEARYGSLTHWAYATDKEEKKKGGASHERQRREVVSANNLAVAAQIVHDADSIAAKSEARREAMLANKRSRNQHIDSDFDDRPPAKKTQKRKPIATDAVAVDARGVGLGITGNGTTQQGKRKKTEKALAAAAPAMERSLSGALQAASAGGRSGVSPRATPGAEINGPKRKPRAAPGPPPGRKRIGPNYSPPQASSPLVPNFKIATVATERPVSARARKNSTANSVASAVQEAPPVGRRPSSSHSVRQLASSNAITELEQAASIIRENLSTKGDSTPKEPVEAPAPPESSNLKHEEPEPQEPEPMEIDIPTPAPVAPRAGRTSKTATPVVGAFPDVPMVRSRSTRNANNGNGGGSNSHASSENNSTTTGTVSKRGHKKNVPSTTTAALPSPALKATNPKSGPPSESGDSVVPEPEFSDGVDEDGDEPRYCYCNEVSYGNMVACDNDTCPREWFHLACVNMEKPPNSRTKWFCSEDCKEAQQARGKGGKGGRPGSSRQ
ncbi:hypothetical protein BCR34DRAFT_573232 [Clohesyomyces aquaticus]|uniref:Chromatin modification-related protein n=1 Tax=Clohesyomyces aquaticus TaxID=1231657 RepID=A0A1Y1Z0M1_9PLEO|nr:hypothetical protein BCR34DRAFT_573232 [Clohesyomyces aquaticus]